jgi:hypothetical protein
MPNEFGIPKIFRFSTTDESKYERLFVGIFNCDLTESANFFYEVFGAEEARVMTGRSQSDGPVPPPPDGPTDPPAPIDPTPLFFRKNVPKDAPKLIRLAVEHLQPPNPFNPVTSSLNSGTTEDDGHFEGGEPAPRSGELPIVRVDKKKDRKRGTLATG